MSIFEKENRMVLVTFIICLLIIGFTINYTYSFFAVEKINSSVITGEVESMKLNVIVTRVAPTTDSKLVPQLDAYITYAVIGRTGNCLDDNGNTVCHVYKVTLENQGSSSVNVSGSLALTTTNNNLKWARITGLTSPTLINDVKTPEESDFVISDELQSGTSRDYYMVVWISETGSSQTDSNNYTGVVTFTTIDGNMAGSTNIANRYAQIDNSGANAPAYVENLIPVMYYTDPETSESNWVVADTTSSTSEYGWYDYDAKKWANAVLVDANTRQALENTKDANGNYESGTPIGDTETDGVLAFYVWIPRYKYKVWNINKIVGIDTYNAYTTGIDIEFETKTETTGTIICSYMYTEPSSLAGQPNEICSDVSGGEGYYTHPAFKFGNDNIEGFWMGKFELSSIGGTASNYGGSNTKSLNPIVLPNVVGWRYNTVSNFWYAINQMQVSGNIYGLTSGKTIADTHMLTNMEWGAVAYLTHSIYGRCTESSCTEVAINNSGNKDNKYVTYTGRSSGSSTSTSYTELGTYTYNDTNGQLASTTGNIYGVYDMSGGAWEYVMGNISDGYGNYTYYASNAGNNYTYEGNEKYVIPYAYGETHYNNQIAFNRARLGDVTAESILSVGDNGGWNSDYSYFARGSNAWFRNGGYFANGTSAGIFSFASGGGSADSYVGTRASLIGF